MAVPQIRSRQGHEDREGHEGDVLRLLTNDFVVAWSCSFANHPSRCRLDRPSISGDCGVAALHGRGQTTRAAITRDQDAILRLEAAPIAGGTVRAEVHGPD